MSRTYTFGEKGVSSGQFFNQWLRGMQLNSDPTPFKDPFRTDLTYLHKDIYDPAFLGRVGKARRVSLDDALRRKRKPGQPASQPAAAAASGHDLRVDYTSLRQYETFTRRLGIMDDIKAGVPRGAYKGVVAIRIDDGGLLFLAPQGT